MKKVIFGLFALLMTTCAFAQMPQFNAEDMAKMRADRIKETCKTSDDQYKKIYDYFIKESKEMMAQFEQGQGGPGGFDMEAMQKRMQEQEKFLKSVLTEDQYKKYDEEQQRMRQGGPGGFGGGFGR